MYDISMLDRWVGRTVGIGQVGVWRDLLKDFGASLLPFLIDEKFVEQIPEVGRLGQFKREAQKFPSRTFKTYPGAAWVLMAHLDKYAKLPDPFFKPGFLFPLEWRKVESGRNGNHSELLPEALLELADKVKRQFEASGFAAEDFYLHPWHGFRDTVDFSKMDASFDSAWGALATGLFSVAVAGAKKNRSARWAGKLSRWFARRTANDGMLANWPFSSIAFDFENNQPEAVAHLGEKVAIVARYGGSEIAVAPNQYKETKGSLYKILRCHRVRPFAWTWGTRFRDALKSLSRCNQCNVSRAWIWGIVLFLVTFAFCLLLAFCIWDAQREVVRYYADFDGIFEGDVRGVSELTERDVSNRAHSYRFIYRGVDDAGKRVLRRISCVNANGEIVPTRWERVVGIGDAKSWMNDLVFSEGGRVVTGKDVLGLDMFRMRFSNNPVRRVRMSMLPPHVRGMPLYFMSMWPQRQMQPERLNHVDWTTYEKLIDCRAGATSWSYVLADGYDEPEGLFGMGKGVVQVVHTTELGGELVRYADSLGNPVRDRLGYYGYRRCKVNDRWVSMRSFSQSNLSDSAEDCVVEFCYGKEQPDCPNRVSFVKSSQTNVVSIAITQGNPFILRFVWETASPIRSIEVIQDGISCEERGYAGDGSTYVHRVERRPQRDGTVVVSDVWRNGSGRAMDPVGQMLGDAVRIYVIDKEGDLLLERHCDAAGQLSALPSLGRVTLLRSKTKLGYEISCHDINGTAVMCDDGWHRMQISTKGVDGKGNSYSSYRFFDLSNNNVTSKLNCCFCKLVKFGSKLQESWLYGVDEKTPMEMVGVHHQQYCFQDGVRKYRVRSFDKSDKPICVGVGGPSVLGFERKQNEVIKTYWDELIGGNLQDNGLGYSTERDILDFQGRVCEVRWRKSDGSFPDRWYDHAKVDYETHVGTNREKEKRITRIEKCYCGDRLVKQIPKSADSRVMFGHGETFGGGEWAFNSHTNIMAFITSLASFGNPTSQYEYAECLLQGDGVLPDFNAAMTYLQRSAKQGYGPALLKLGLLYLQEYDNRRWNSSRKEFGMLNDFELLLGAEDVLSASGLSEAEPWLARVNQEMPLLLAKSKSSDGDNLEAGTTRTLILPGNVEMVFCWCPSTVNEKWRNMANGHCWYLFGSKGKARIVLTSGFWMAQTPVTQRQYESVMGLLPESCYHRNPTWPVNGVSWSNSVAFCERVTKMLKGAKVCLPTTAQWEYACRAGTNILQETMIGDYAWFRGNSGKKGHPVGQKTANAWKLHDMLGGVREWCSDGLEEQYVLTGVRRTLVDPFISSALKLVPERDWPQVWSQIEIEYMQRCAQKSVRGGCWLDERASCVPYAEDMKAVDDDFVYANGLRPIMIEIEKKR